MHACTWQCIIMTLTAFLNFLGSQSFTEDDGQTSSAYSMVGKFPKQNAQSHAIMGIHTHTHTHTCLYMHTQFLKLYFG